MRSLSSMLYVIQHTLGGIRLNKCVFNDKSEFDAENMTGD